MDIDLDEGQEPEVAPVVEDQASEAIGPRAVPPGNETCSFVEAMEYFGSLKPPKAPAPPPVPPPTLEELLGELRQIEADQKARRETRLMLMEEQKSTRSSLNEASKATLEAELALEESVCTPGEAAITAELASLRGNMQRLKDRSKALESRLKRTGDVPRVAGPTSDAA